MSQEPIARLGDTSDHGGYIISAAITTYTNGIRTSRVGDMHFCPIKGHGVTPIVSGSDTVVTEGSPTACRNSQAGCGARMVYCSPNAYVPFSDGPPASEYWFTLDDPIIGLLDNDVPRHRLWR